MRESRQPDGKAGKWKGKKMEKVTISKRAAVACLDVLNIWLEDIYELDKDTRSQILAYDELSEVLGEEWETLKSAKAQELLDQQKAREEELRSPAALGQWLRYIFDNGDQDETSWKHLGHAFAALVHLGNWELAKDYERPWPGSLPKMEQTLKHWWERIAKILENDREGTLEEANRLAELAKTNWREYGYAGHLTAYLEEYEGAAH